MVIAVTHPFDRRSKSKTALHLARKFANGGNSVLLIDLACESFITRELGFRNLSKTMIDVMNGYLKLDDIIVRYKNFAFAPADFTLKLINISLAWSNDRNKQLRKVLDGLELKFDAIIIDCDSSLSFLTVNALNACQMALLPVYSPQNPKEPNTTIHLLGCEEIMRQKAQLISNRANILPQLSEKINNGCRLLVMEQPIWTQDHLLPELAAIKKEDPTLLATEQIQDFTFYLN